MSAPAVWDAIVVGAGPAGAVAARQLALAGRRVLLVDQQRLPRDKPCGGCLGAPALTALRRLGLSRVLPAAAATPLRRLLLHAPGGRIDVPWPEGAIVARAAFDHALVRAAVAAGVVLRDGVRASLRPGGGRGPRGDVQAPPLALRLPGAEVLERARLVVAADGLLGALLREHPTLSATRVRGARVGAATACPPALAASLRALAALHGGELLMVLGATGYVGLAARGEGLQIAAALDAPAVMRAGGAGRAAAQVLREAGLAAPSAFTDLPWKATPPLARDRRSVAVPGLLVAGDAAGYGEPLTGEGIAWALEGADALARLAVAHDAHALPHLWQRRHTGLTAARRRTSRRLAGLLTRAPAQALLVALARHRPAWIAAAARHVSRPPGGRLAS